MIFYDKNFNQTAKQFGLNLIKEKKNRAYLRNFYRSLMIL